MDNSFIGDTLFNVYKALKTQIEMEFNSIGIGYGQIKILMKLFTDVDASMKQSDLSLSLGIDKSNTSRSIMKLKQKDYVEVVLLNKRDRAVRLTNNGKLLKPIVLQTLNNISSRMTNDISAKDLQITNQVLQSMEGNLE